MIHLGNCLDILPTIPAGSVQTCITSPPYFGLRDYGCDGQIGLEPTPDEFVATLVAVFREVRRVLRDDGTLWLNLGDSYAGNGGQGVQSGPLFKGRARQRENVCVSSRIKSQGLKPKDLCGIPWMVAFALRADGWHLRQDIIWAKPNPMPESVTDRCTKSHEYLFLLTKAPRYYFDAAAIAEPLAESSLERLSQPALEQQRGSDRVPGKSNGRMKAVTNPENAQRISQSREQYRAQGQTDSPGLTRNKRSVWTVPTTPYREAHFATFPERLIEPCMLAGSRAGDMVFDPFMGAGTTAVVAERLGRRWIGCELNPDYVAIAERRIHAIQPGLALGAA